MSFRLERRCEGEEPTTWAVYGDKTVTATFIVDTMAETYTGCKGNFGDTSWLSKRCLTTNKLTSFTYHYFDGTSEIMPFGDYSGWPRRRVRLRDSRTRMAETIKCNSIDATPTSSCTMRLGCSRTAKRATTMEVLGTVNLSRDRT